MTIQKLESPYDIDFSKLSLPEGTTREDIIQRYKSEVDDLEHLEREYKRFIGDRTAPLQLLTMDLYGSIQRCVHYDNEDKINLSLLSKLVPRESRSLYVAIVKMVFGVVDGKPLSDVTLNKFKGLLCYYLCVAGF